MVYKLNEKEKEIKKLNEYIQNVNKENLNMLNEVNKTLEDIINKQEKTLEKINSEISDLKIFIQMMYTVKVNDNKNNDKNNDGNT